LEKPLKEEKSSLALPLASFSINQFFQLDSLDNSSLSEPTANYNNTTACHMWD
jgi:hypothetical protein